MIFVKVGNCTGPGYGSAPPVESGVECHGRHKRVSGDLQIWVGVDYRVTIHHHITTKGREADIEMVFPLFHFDIWTKGNLREA